ncbi:hypothetical protein DU002_02170 [Corallincola holothuriorum]|uniref:SSD domain-containing protein n=1 Tax=Corallincola holothuriorum TaxID=2282215 RepID=A0A368NRP7_9GAMM|nr:MMPL family transporter [Corallincola holothuriorum]RCU52790.1 hypothetical protein DU002_02170 [Corallincola holothuriorum]
MKAKRLFFSIWLTILFTLAVLSFVIFKQGFQVNTNLMALFPEAEQSPIESHASKRLALTQGRRIALLISHAAPEKLKILAPLIESELLESQLFDIKEQLSEQSQLADLYRNYHHQLFSDTTRRQLEVDADTLLTSGLVAFYNPFVGISPQEYLNDPALTLRNFMMSRAQSDKLILENGRLWHKSDDANWLFLPLMLKADPYNFRVQEKLLTTINNVKLRHPELTINYTGTAFYAAYGADSARSEISTIGVGSILGILLLMVWVFRSLTPLILAGVAISVGIVAAALLTHIVFGSIHIFTLVFGACLIGVSIDYAFHYFSHQSQANKDNRGLDTVSKIFPGISLGLVSSATAYAALSLAPFPGLRQVALFSATGLCSAYLTVILAFPTFMSSRRKPANKVPWANKALIEFWQQLNMSKRGIIAAVVMLTCIPALILQKNDDNIRNLQSLDPTLQSMEQQFKQLLGGANSPRFLLSTSDDAESLLQMDEEVVELIQQSSNDSKVIGLSRFVPSARQQELDYNLYLRQVVPKTYTALVTAGFPEETAHKQVNRLKGASFNALTLTEWLDSPASAPWRFLWIDDAANKKNAAITLIQSTLSTHKLQQILPHDVRVIDPAEQYSKLFGRYRQQISWLLLLAYVVIFALLNFRYSWRRAVAVISVPAGGCLLTLGALSLASVPLNLFHALALILVTGISIDYSIFFAETQKNPETTLLSIALASTTTMLSFGLLGLSATPAVSAVGITVSLGIIFAYLLSPLAFQHDTDQKGGYS